MRQVVRERTVSRRGFLAEGAALASVLAAACGTGGTQTAVPKGGASTSLQGALTYRTWWAPSTEAHATWWNFVKPDFEAKHPGATLNLEFVAFGDMFEKYVASAAAGDVPDALHSSIVWGRDFWAAGTLADLAPAVARNASLAMDKFIPSALFYNQTGKAIFGIPHEGPDANILYYNASHFQAVGLDPAPKAVDKWTWDDFNQAAVKLNRPQPDGTFERLGYVVPGLDLPLFAAWVYTQGATFYTKDLAGVGFDNEKGESVLQLQLDLLHRIGAPLAGQAARDLFLQGKAAIISANMFMIGDLRLPATKPAFDWNVMAYPKGPLGTSRSTNVFVNMDTVPKQSKRRDLAEAWLLYYTGLEMARHRMRLLGRLNPRKEFYDTPEYKQAMAEQAQLSRIPDLAAVGNPYPFLRYTELTRDALPFLKDAIAGTRTVKEGVREAARLANQTLSAAAKG